MKTKFGIIFAALSMIGVLVPASSSVVAAQPIDTPEIQAAVRNAATSSDHEAIAQHYENTASRMRALVKEKNELLEHYEDKSYLYGRQAQDLQSQTSALIREYAKSEKASAKLATLHRQMAAQLNQNRTANMQLLESATGL
jgi:hypothetical protein